MGSDTPNDKDNPPVTTFPLLEHIEFGFPISGDVAADYSGLLHSGNTTGSDLMYTSLPVNPFPWQNTNAAYLPCTQSVPESCGISMADFMKLNSLQAPQIDLMRSKTPRNLNPSEISFPEQMVRGVHHSTNNDYSMSADSFMIDGTGACSFQNPQARRNMMLMRGNAAGGCRMNRHGGEANSSNINRPQSNRSFVGHVRPMLHHTQNNDQNNGEIKTDNSAKVVNADQYSRLEKIDGSFLSLGLGDNTKARSKPYFSTREIPSKLEEAASPNLRTSHVGHAMRSYSSLDHNLGVGFSNSLNNAGGLSIPSHNSGGSTSGYDVGAARVADTGLSSSPLHILQTPQVDMQQNICNPSNRKLGSVSKGDGSVSKGDAIYGNFDAYIGFRGDQPAPSGAYGSSPTAHVSSRQIRLPELASGSDNRTLFTTGTASNQLQNIDSAKSLSSESSLNSPFLGVRGSSGRQGRSGPMFSGLGGSTTQTAGSNQFIRRIGGQPTGQLFSAHDGSVAPATGGNLFPNTVGLQTTSNSASIAVAGGMFPKRLGVQVLQGAAEGAPFPREMSVHTASKGTPITTAQSAEGDPFPKGMGVQTSNKLCRPQPSGPVQYRRDLLQPPFNIGRPKGLPLQFPTEFRGSSTAIGQPQNSVPAQYWRPMSTSGQVIPVAKVNELGQVRNILGRPSLKRGAMQPHPAAPYVQRRKLTHQPLIRPSMPCQPQHGPAPASVHIKWPGSDGRTESTGEKCLLCKRDLTFSPEGPVEQPPILPAVAVLPCGHTFHDHCLQLITPEDQSKSPPCIPCAIGEN